MIVTPCHWYQATSPLKLMIDCLVCADSSNCDTTKCRRSAGYRTQGMGYRAILPDELFLSSFMAPEVSWMRGARLAIGSVLWTLNPLRRVLDRYIGYWKPYATSHDDLDHGGKPVTGGEARGPDPSGQNRLDAKGWGARAQNAPRELKKPPL